MKKIISIVLVLLMTVGIMAGCKTAPKEEPSTPEVDESVSEPSETPEEPAGEKTVISVASLESAYGAEVWQEIKKAYETANENIEVELIIEKNLEDVIGASMKAGDYPDVVHLGIGREAALTETLIKEKGIEDITDLFDRKVYGEEITVKEKLEPGFLDNLTVKPYGGDEIYLAPMFYGPCGLFFNKALLTEKGWAVPTTWDEMWELGDKAKAEGIALFTYPTTGYFDAFFYSLLNGAGGRDFFDKAMVYTEGIWETDEAKKAFDIVEKLASYTEPSTPGNANGDNFQKNQQLILDNKAIFMPNGTWVVGEMAEAPRAEGFEWGFTALPAVEAGGVKYSYSFFEQIWIPSGSENIEAAKEFITFLYSDIAVDIFQKHGAVQPVKGVVAKLDDEQKLFYNIYSDGAEAVVGSFASTESVEGININSVIFDPVNSLVTKDKTKEVWVADIITASDALRGALTK